MNGKDRKDLDVILYRLDEQDRLREGIKKDFFVKLKELENSMSSAHKDTREDLKFIKENLFDPEKGLWAETKSNTIFKNNVARAFWFIVPASIASVIKILWDSLRGS